MKEEMKKEVLQRTEQIKEDLSLLTIDLLLALVEEELEILEMIKEDVKDPTNKIKYDKKVLLYKYFLLEHKRG